jgi:hypothetical protein
MPLTTAVVSVDVDPASRGSFSGGTFHATNVFAVLISLCRPCCFDDRHFCGTGRRVAKRSSRLASPAATPAEAATDYDNNDCARPNHKCADHDSTGGSHHDAGHDVAAAVSVWVEAVAHRAWLGCKHGGLCEGQRSSD